MVLVTTLAFLFALVASIVYLVTIYNGLVALKNDIDKSWANIDVLLKQRHDELTKLLDTTKGYMDFERETLTKIIQARSQYQQAVTLDQKVQADQTMTSALRGFFAVAENYPELKANQNVLELQEQLTTTENQISFSRQHYNASVLDYNNAIQVFPAVLLAGMFGFTKREFFDAEPEAATVPTVDLNLS